jgi:hypothetical protein
LDQELAPVSVSGLELVWGLVPVQVSDLASAPV